MADWLEQVGRPAGPAPRTVDLAPAIVGVWENYKLYLERGRDLSAWHREVPSLFVFDDHEILNDVNGTGTVGLRDRRAAFRDVGVQAWYDYLGWSNPIPERQGIRFGRASLTAGSNVLVDPEADFRDLRLDEAATLMVHWGGPTAGVNDLALDALGGDPNAGVYEVVEVLDATRLRVSPAADATGSASYSIGRLSYFSTRMANTEFFVLDTRSHRELHDIADPFAPDISVLGDRQKAWLQQAMRSSAADFLFVVSSVNLMVPHVLPGPDKRNKDEAWTAVAAEREELIDFWDSLGKPVLVLTGDLHNSFAIRITDRVGPAQLAQPRPGRRVGPAAERRLRLPRPRGRDPLVDLLPQRRRRTAAAAGLCGRQRQQRLPERRPGRRGRVGRVPAPAGRRALLRWSERGPALRGVDPRGAVTPRVRSVTTSKKRGQTAAGTSLRQEAGLLLNVGEYEPYIVQVHEVRVCRQECRPACMSRRGDPDVILLHRNGRFRGRRVARRRHGIAVSPGIDSRVRVQDPLVADVEGRHAVEHVLEARTFSAAPSILFGKRQNFSVADGGSEDHRILIPEIELCPRLHGPVCFPDETEQKVGIQEETLH